MKHQIIQKTLEKQALNIIEDAILSSSKKPPFWFGNESEDEIRILISTYEEFLNLNANRSSNSRRPLSYVGKVVRTVIHNSKKNVFETSDLVFVYNQQLSVRGTLFQPIQIYNGKTTWDVDQAFPLKFKVIMQGGSPGKQNNFILKKSIFELDEDEEEEESNNTSVLIKEPFFSVNPILNFKYTVEQNNRNITYANNLDKCIDMDKSIFERIRAWQHIKDGMNSMEKEVGKINLTDIKDDDDDGEYIIKRENVFYGEQENDELQNDDFDPDESDSDFIEEEDDEEESDEDSPLSSSFGFGFENPFINDPLKENFFVLNV